MVTSILIVDDDPDVLVLFSRILEEGGFKVYLAISGEHALDIVGTTGVDLIILDLSMAPPDGFELLKTLRTSMPQLPVVVASGYLQGSLLKAAELFGATAALSKLDAPTRLLDTVHEALRRPRGHHAKG